MILLIDNYDSFTYNLVQYFQTLHQDVSVYTHDTISIDEIKTLSPTHLVISPGPNGPEEAGISLSVIREFYQKLPILGVCLGHQCIAHAFGGKIIQATQIMHGKTSTLTHSQQGLFKDLPSEFDVMRYHSLAVCPQSLPACLTIDAWADDTIMSLSHRDYPVFGVQFHPESILSEHGLALLAQFLKR